MGERLFDGFRVRVLQFASGGEPAAERAYAKFTGGGKRQKGFAKFILGMFAVGIGIERQNHLAELPRLGLLFHFCEKLLKADRGRLFLKERQDAAEHKIAALETAAFFYHI